MTPLVVTYHTRSYAPVADEYLLPSLRTLGLDYRLEVCGDFPTWEAGCGHKASVILDAYRSGRSLLWLDADARIYSDPWPYLTSLDCDVSAHMFRGVELISSAVYFAPNLSRIEWLLHKWEAGCKAAPGEWDQRVLQSLIFQSGAVFEPLPPEYCWIDALSEQHYGKREGVVIGQFQVSRKMKRAINNAA